MLSLPLKNQIESTEKFRPFNQIRIFEQKEIKKHLKLIKRKLKQYKFLFLETIEKNYI